MNKGQNHLGTDNISRLVLRLAIPAMLAQFVNVLYSIIDRMYIGNIPVEGAAALAGAGICGPATAMLSAFAAWIGIGGAPLMSIKMGQKDNDGAAKILANCFLLLLAAGLVLMGPAYAFKDALLVRFGATPAIFPYADQYMRIYLLGTIFAILSLGLNQFIICQGFSGLGMCSVVIGAICNIILDPVLIFGLHMGVSGAALATVLSQAASCAFTLGVLFGRKIPIGITFRGYDPKICLKVLVVGLTPFLIILFDNVLIILQNVLLKRYGGPESDLLLTCNTIVQSFMMMITMPLAGITGGTQAILGYNYGAGSRSRVRQAQKVIVCTALVFCAVMFLFAQLAPALFAGMFTRDPVYLGRTVGFIRIYTLGVIPLAVQYAIVDGFTGMGIAKAALPLSFARKGIYICLVIVLCVTKGAEYLFWAEPFSDIVSPVISAAVFFLVLPKLLYHREKAA